MDELDKLDNMDKKAGFWPPFQVEVAKAGYRRSNSKTFIGLQIAQMGADDAYSLGSGHKSRFLVTF